MKSFLSLEQRDFTYGSFKYRYGLIFQNRKTINLTVSPNLSITLKSPRNLAPETIDGFLKRKWFWLEKQLRFFKKHQRKKYIKEYLSGESFLYLGRQYKLLIREWSGNKVGLNNGQLLVHTAKKTNDSNHTKKLLSEWYAQRIEKVFHERYTEMQSKFDYKTMPRLVVRDMPKRWGSFLGVQKIILNPNLIHAPKECIDYVIVHELCHVRYKRHDSQFFKFLESKYPKWVRVKNQLEEIGSQILN